MIRRAILLTCPIAVLAVGACRQEHGSNNQEAAAEVHGSQIAFQLPERDLVPEGICYDPISESFFLGSIEKHKILRISMDGTVETFVPPRTEGLWSVIGMRVDVERRVLWANSDQGNSVDDSAPDAAKETGIFKFNPDNRNSAGADIALAIGYALDDINLRLNIVEGCNSWIGKNFE